MRDGDVLEDRYELRGLAGRGGMGAVYRAFDKATGVEVAIKSMQAEAMDDAARFEREAKMLAALDHPGVVRFLGHGRAPDGAAFIVMEWLDGVTLRDRLREGAMSPQETLDLGVRIADALSFVHTRGIVHRDIKPTNILLPRGEPRMAKLLDFGLARGPGASFWTRSGAVLGTPAYMAPEQARAEGGIDSRADVFSLGCVLYECMAGRPVFAAEHAVAVIAKVVLEEVPRIGDVRDHVPPELEELIVAMMAKDRTHRPRDGAEVARMLAMAATGAAGTPSERARTGPMALTAKERRLLSVVVAAPAGHSAKSAATTVMQDRDDTTLTTDGEVETLPDGNLVVVLRSDRSSDDVAARAARCALDLRRRHGVGCIAIATGRGEDDGPRPLGDALDRAASLVFSQREQREQGEGRDDALARGADPSIVLDELTAGLLERHFQVTEEGGRRLLVGEIERLERERTLLGHRTPCVGRDRELGTIEALWRESTEEEVPRVMLITAAAGVGKSRLAHEAIARLRAVPGRPCQVWVARGDPIKAGSPYALLAEALRSACGIRRGDVEGEQARRLRERMSRHLEPAERDRVAAFIGEICGVPLHDAEVAVALDAARRDAVLMRDQLARAFDRFVGAECAHEPLVLLLDDVHWADKASVELLELALRARRRRLVVLAFGRPEVHETFPRMFAGRHAQIMSLPPLAPRACEHLVRRALGEETPTELVSMVVERADGNAFYLEEIVRAVADGRTTSLPDTVIATVLARLEALPPNLRRVLRAASIFGDIFWRGGLEALLGGAAKAMGLRSSLASLVEREVIGAWSEGRIAHEEEYRFRHSLLREAVYETLTREDRILGHRLAATWLERADEHPVVLAEHYARGELFESASTSYLDAARRALDANDLGAAQAHAERSVELGAHGELLGEARQVQAALHRWRGENEIARKRASEALSLLSKYSGAWFAGLTELSVLAGRMRDRQELNSIGEALRDAVRDCPKSVALLQAVATFSMQLIVNGDLVGAESTLRELGDEVLANAPVDARAALLKAKAFLASCSGRFEERARLLESTVGLFQQAGDARAACEQLGNVGFARMVLGDHEVAEQALRQALRLADDLELSELAAFARHNLGMVLGLRGAHQEAIEVESQALQAYREQGDRRLELGSICYLARIHLLAGRPKDAELLLLPIAQAPALAEEAALNALVLAALTEACLGVQRAEEALAHARTAAAIQDGLGDAVDDAALYVRWALAAALWATGRREEAGLEVRRALDLMSKIAVTISEPAVRDHFLNGPPENARIRAMAKEWEQRERGGA